LVPTHLATELRLSAATRATAVTANGLVVVHEAMINHLIFGPFDLTDVRGNLNPGMGGDDVLLGMCELKILEFTQRRDVLELRLPRR
jgi:aspartyl protease family protein